MTVTFKKDSLTTIFWEAFVLRLLVLLFILHFDDEMALGFSGANTLFDDYRYEHGGLYYATNAVGLFDLATFVKAFILVGDWIGVALAENPLFAAPLWYWLVCLLMYMTNTFIAVRVFNVFVASLAVIYVYKFAEEVYGTKTAVLASKLLAFLPLPVIFSCFAYKDQLIMLLTFFLLYNAVNYRNTQRMRQNKAFLLLLAAIMLLLLRSGLSVVLISLCLFIGFTGKWKFNVRNALIITVVIAASFVLFTISYDTVVSKVFYYLQRHETQNAEANIAFLTISSFYELYKLPFAYIFSILMPIGLHSTLDSWYSVVAHLNLLMAPVAVGAGMYLLHNKKDKLVFWSTFAYYVISIVFSINNFRHYYSLIPLSLIAFSDYFTTSDNNGKLIVVGGGFLMALTLLIFYYLRV